MNSEDITRYELFNTDGTALSLLYFYANLCALISAMLSCWCRKRISGLFQAPMHR